MADVAVLSMPLALRTASGQWQATVPDAPPLAVLEVVRLLGAAGHLVHAYQPTNVTDDWLGALLAGAAPDRVVLPVNYFNWPAVRQWLRERYPGTAPPALLVPTGPYPTACQAELTGYGDQVGWLDPTSFEALCELPPAPAPGAGPGLGAGLPMLEQLTDWPTWDRGLSNVDLFGFPLPRQPHPWNLPTVPVIEPATLAAWHDQVGPAVVTMREAELSLTRPPGAWDRDGMDVLGRLTMACTQEQGHPPALIARVAPSELLADSVAESLSVLPVRQIDLLAGSCGDAALGRAGVDYDQATVEAALASLQRVGLADRTVLSIVVGLPGESLPEALLSLRTALGLTATYRLAAVRFEWWLNLPGSPLHVAGSEWERSLGESGVPAGDLRQLPAPAPGTLGGADRKVLADLVEVVRFAQRSGTVVGPSLLEVGG